MGRVLGYPLHLGVRSQDCKEGRTVHRVSSQDSKEGRTAGPAHKPHFSQERRLRREKGRLAEFKVTLDWRIRRIPQSELAHRTRTVRCYSDYSAYLRASCLPACCTGVIFSAWQTNGALTCCYSQLCMSLTVGGRLRRTERDQQT